MAQVLEQVKTSLRCRAYRPSDKQLILFMIQFDYCVFLYVFYQTLEKNGSRPHGKNCVARAGGARTAQVAQRSGRARRCGGTGACCSAGVLTQLERGRGLLRDVVELPKRPGRLRNIAQFAGIRHVLVVYWQPI